MINYPGKAKTSYKKTVNYSNRGMNLEELINLMLDNNEKKNNGRVITKAYFKEPSTLDYNGIYKGKYVDFDAKVTQSKTSFPLSNLHTHQYEHIKNVIKHGGISFLIISINSEFYLLDGNDIINFIENNTKKSIPYEYIKEKGIEIESKIKPRLDYIKAIDKKYF